VQQLWQGLQVLPPTISRVPGDVIRLEGCQTSPGHHERRIHELVLTAVQNLRAWHCGQAHKTMVGRLVLAKLDLQVPPAKLILDRLDLQSLAPCPATVVSLELKKSHVWLRPIACPYLASYSLLLLPIAHIGVLQP
jgi:hypothetical protein